jgi:hypothetical protein
MEPATGVKPRMHDNGCYVKLTRIDHEARIPQPPARDQKKFAEPVSVSSTAFADLPLAGTALELGFDLLRFRARRKWQSRDWTGALQGSPNTSRPQFAEIQFSTFPQRPVQLVDNPSPLPPDKVGACRISDRRRSREG